MFPEQCLLNKVILSFPSKAAQKLSQSQTHSLGHCHQTTVTNTSSKAERKLNYLDFLWSLRNMPKASLNLEFCKIFWGRRKKERKTDRDRHRHTHRRGGEIGIY